MKNLAYKTAISSKSPSAPMKWLNANGHAYVTIRVDKTKLSGYTKTGTFQTYVTMPINWKLLHKGSGYELYEYIG